MSKKIRIQENNYKFLHVIVKGIDKENIFYNEFFKRNYLKYLKDESKKYNIMILAYCLMDTHAHFLVKHNKIYELSDFFHKINTKFAILYNKKKERKGYVFLDRFKSIPIKHYKQLIHTLVYIHNNPVKANMIKTPGEYKYSSYNEYLTKFNIVTPEANNIIFHTNDFSKFKEDYSLLHKKYQNIFKEDGHYNIKEIINKLKSLDKNEGEIINILYNKYEFSFREIEEEMKITRYRIKKIYQK